MGKGSFILYDKDLQGVLLLSEYQAGKLFKALAKYRLEGEKTSFGNNLTLTVLFQQFIDHIAINEEKYKALCERNAQSARKRWNNRESDDSVCAGMPTHASACIYDNDNDNDNENDNDNDNDNDARGAKKENKKINNNNKNIPKLLQGEPSYDIDAFIKKSIGLKYQKKEM